LWEMGSPDLAKAIEVQSMGTSVTTVRAQANITFSAITGSSPSSKVVPRMQA